MLQDFLNGKQVSAPVLSKQLQPWKKEGVTDEDLVFDLMACILKFWNINRGNTDYSQSEAISDAYGGILKAKEKDALAPRFGKKKKIKCKCCKNLFDPPIKNIGDDRADLTYKNAPYGRTPKYRKILVKCSTLVKHEDGSVTDIGCGHKQLETVRKSAFSSLAFCLIRSAIQRNARRYHKTEISMNADNNVSNEMIATSTEREEKIPEVITKALYQAIDGLVERQRLVLVLHHGLGNIYAKTTEKECKCDNCDNSFISVVDYNIPKNHIKCPHCEHDNIFDMRITKTTKCHYCAEDFNATIDYSKSKNYCDCLHCGTENSIDMSLNQTDIAKILSVSKQRVCSIIRTVNNRLREALGDSMIEHI